MGGGRSSHQGPIWGLHLRRDTQYDDGSALPVHHHQQQHPTPSRSSQPAIPWWIEQIRKDLEMIQNWRMTSKSCMDKMDRVGSASTQ